MPNDMMESAEPVGLSLAAVAYGEHLDQFVPGHYAVVDDEWRDRHRVYRLGGVPAVFVDLVPVRKQRQRIDGVQKFLRYRSCVLWGVLLDVGANRRQIVAGTASDPDAVSLGHGALSLLVDEASAQLLSHLVPRSSLAAVGLGKAFFEGSLRSGI